MPDEVRYERRGTLAVVTMNRPRYRNAQNSAMTYALDAAFTRAVDDGEVKVIVLAGAGEHFSAGTTPAARSATRPPRSPAGRGSGGITPTRPAPTGGTPGRSRCTSAGAGGG